MNWLNEQMASHTPVKQICATCYFVVSKIFIAWDLKYIYQDIHFSVYDIYGSKIENQKFDFTAESVNTGTVSWYLSSISSGIYIIELEVGGYKRVQKVIVY